MTTTPTHEDLMQALDVIKRYAKENSINSRYKDTLPDVVLISAGLAVALNHDPNASLTIAANLAEDVNYAGLAEYIRNYDPW